MIEHLIATVIATFTIGVITFTVINSVESKLNNSQQPAKKPKFAGNSADRRKARRALRS